MRVQTKSLNYYSCQSIFSDPKEYKYLFENLPDPIDKLCEVMQGVIVHQHDTKIYGFNVPKNRQFEANARYVSKILKTIIDLQNDKLPIKRVPEKRFIGLCRDFAIVLCSILRYKGIPARLRCGFATYYEPGWYVDHWLCEYWNDKENRWVLVDTEVNEAVRKEYKLKPSFNSLNVNHEQFILSGKAWQMCRLGKVDPKKFGVPRINVLGLWFVVGNLLRDLAALNKIELLPWDYTEFTDRQFDNVSELSKKETTIIDKVAEAIEGVYDDFGKIVAVYQNTPQFQIHQEVVSYTNLGPKKIKLRI